MKLRRPQGTGWGRRVSVGLAAAVVAPMILVAFAGTAQAAKSAGCENGGYAVVSSGGATLVKATATTVTTTFTADALGATFGIRGLYTQFDIRSTDFAVLNQAFTGAANPLDMTGGYFTPVFASKVPQDMVLDSSITVTLGGESLEVGRTGTGVSMKIQAKDCAQGGVFQMEPQRSSGALTTIVHTLATSAATAKDPKGAELTPFYFDNPNFRAQIGQFLGADCTSVVTGPPSKFCVQVTARTNIANDRSPKFVLRDSTQVATRIAQTGRTATFTVASGGRLGYVTGEDSTEVANPPTTCTHQCQAQNQVRGRLVVLGFPFPVPAASRL
jgi:hypothetical protein